jgi:Glycosyl hydrolase family 26
MRTRKFVQASVATAFVATAVAGSSAIATPNPCAQPDRRSPTCAHVAEAPTAGIAAVSSDAATVSARLAGRGPVAYRFEYRRLGAGARHTAVRRLVVHVSAVVRATLRQLIPDATYRFRVAISDLAGTSYGAWRSFTTTARSGPAVGRSGTLPAAPGRGASPTLRTPPPPPGVRGGPATPLPAPGGGTGAARSLLWGAQIGSQLTGMQPPWDMSAVSDFAALVGKAPAILPFNIPFQQCGGTCNWWPFPTTLMNTIRSYGSIPMLNWASMSSPLANNGTGWTLQQVIDGDFDSYIRSFAAGAAAWGHPLFLRFDWEMNGTWFPWGEPANGNQPGQFVAAWRHVHDLFTAAGATNVSWVWCPSVITTNATADLSELYPGDGYVDWTCMDGYNWGTLHGPTGWQSFNDVFASTYSEIADSIAPTKPMMIGEVGSSEGGGSKAAWISDMFAQLAAGYPDLRALVYFETPDGPDDWPVETSPASTAAFAAGVSSARFATNAFGSLPAGTIAAP